VASTTVAYGLLAEVSAIPPARAQKNSIRQKTAPTNSWGYTFCKMLTCCLPSSITCCFKDTTKPTSEDALATSLSSLKIVKLNPTETVITALPEAMPLELRRLVFAYLDPKQKMEKFIKTDVVPFVCANIASEDELPMSTYVNEHQVFFKDDANLLLALDLRGFDAQVFQASPNNFELVVVRLKIALKIISSFAPSLQSLDVTDCVNYQTIGTNGIATSSFADAFFKLITSNFLNLEFLTFGNNRYLTDAALDEFVNTANLAFSLREANLVGTESLLFSTQGKQLKRLDITGCNQISEKSKQRLRKNLPQVELIG
jgi:hypothetical protein